MTALARDRKTDPIDVNAPWPRLYSLPVEAATTIYGGADVFSNAAGNAVPGAATNTLRCWGRAQKTVINTTAAGFGAAGALAVDVSTGVYFYNNGTGADAFGQGDLYASAYASDDNTACKTDAGGTRPYLGYMVPAGTNNNLRSTGEVAIALGMANPYAVNAELGNASTARKARVVATSIGANTGTTTGTLTITATGALGAQDGVTCVVGDVIFIQEGTANVAAADAGPWVISVIGTTGVSAVLMRPDWWAHGAALVSASSIEIGPDGTGTNPTLAGTIWKVFATGGKIIDTDAPVFWPGRITCAVTLASGTLAAARTTMPVRGHLITTFVISSDPATAPHANTRVWRVSALTAGVTGTASVQVVAESAPGTTNASDVGQYNVTAINW